MEPKRPRPPPKEESEAEAAEGEEGEKEETPLEDPKPKALTFDHVIYPNARSLDTPETTFEMLKGVSAVKVRLPAPPRTRWTRRRAKPCCTTTTGTRRARRSEPSSRSPRTPRRARRFVFRAADTSCSSPSTRATTSPRTSGRSARSTSTTPRRCSRRNNSPRRRWRRVPTRRWPRATGTSGSDGCSGWRSPRRSPRRWRFRTPPCPRSRASRW